MVSYLNTLIWLREEVQITENLESTHRSSTQVPCKAKLCELLFAEQQSFLDSETDFTCFGGSLLGREPVSFGVFLLHPKHLLEVTAKQSGVNVNEAKTKKQKR